MNKKEDTPFADQMASFLPSDWLENQAKLLGVVKRQRKVHVTDLVWTLILAFGTGKDTTLAALRSTFTKQTGLNLAASSFRERFTPQFTSMMSACLDHVLEQARLQLPSHNSSWLSRFSNITAIDSSTITIHRNLRHLWPSVKNEQAAIKIHAVYNVAHCMPQKFKLTAGTTHDSKPWKKIGKWVRNHLLLVDLGYYSFSFFERIDRHKGFFISRTKNNFNPVIVDVYNKTAGRAMELKGKTLHEVLPHLKRKVVDVAVEVSIKGRKYKGKRKVRKFKLRMVMVLNQETGRYHKYLCNFPPDELSAMEIAELYGVRWEIEILFKALKSAGGGLVSIPGKTENVVKTLVWASLIKLVLSRLMLRKVKLQRHPTSRKFPHLRWDKYFAKAVDMLLDVFVVRRRTTPKDPIMIFLLEYAPDPNINRNNPLDSLSFF